MSFPTTVVVLPNLMGIDCDSTKTVDSGFGEEYDAIKASVDQMTIPMDGKIVTKV